ncbi:MAG: RecX family transcriptional regulator [Chloroflexi bacterium]|nr:RecX family transcriptional regulator [Chloroflexota bacterium]
MSGKITALKVQARNKQRVNVFLDDRFAFGLAAIEAARLKVGQSLSDEDIARLMAADLVEAAYERALKFLSYRPRAEAEIRRHLRQHDTGESEIDEVMARLKRSGLADDSAFARLWIENRAQFRPKGRRALKAELRQKGLTGDQAEEALVEVDDEEAAHQAARTRARRLAKLSRAEFSHKLSGFLARRGFGYETIETVVERVWREAVEQGLASDADSESEE